MKIEDINALLKENGIKVTRQRIIIVQLLSSSESPMTAEDIYLAIAAAENKALNLSTVYRILDAFTQKGILIKTNLNLDGKSTYELNHREHRHHIVCIACSEIIPVKGCPLGNYEKLLRKTTGYQILGHNLEIRGICPKCQRKNETEDK
jgi:Fur family ferric uptake transcriptional regulator